MPIVLISKEGPVLHSKGRKGRRNHNGGGLEYMVEWKLRFNLRIGLIQSNVRESDGQMKVKDLGISSQTYVHVVMCLKTV